MFIKMSTLDYDFYLSECNFHNYMFKKNVKNIYYYLQKQLDQLFVHVNKVHIIYVQAGT